MKYSFLMSSHPHAKDILFKPIINQEFSWLRYLIVIVLLLMLVLLLSKKLHHRHGKQKSILLLEKTYLGHKSSLYLIGYKQQRFLLVDNQQTLILHQLNEDSSHETFSY